MAGGTQVLVGQGWKWTKQNAGRNLAQYHKELGAHSPPAALPYRVKGALAGFLVGKSPGVCGWGKHCG